MGTISELGALNRAHKRTPAAARFEWCAAALYAVGLVWINLYVCRELFFVPVAAMNSMHGFWAAVAKWADGSWFQSNWWPYWDCGIPFEFTYAPLVPGLTSIMAGLRGVPEILGFQSVTGLVYCLGPLTLFVMAWRLTKAPGYSFLAALFYSLTASTELLVPDGQFSFRHFWDARRLYLLSVWDDTPHALALAIFPLVVLFLVRSIRERRPIFYAAAAVSISLATLASAFGPVMVTTAALCLLFVLRRESYGSNILLTLGIGAYGYAISSPFLSPAVIGAIHTASARGEGGQWTAGSWTALAIVVLGWVVLWRYLPHWTRDWRLQFFTLFAYLTSSIPMVATYLHRSFLPQPNRYKFEMEFALALLAIFGVRRLVQRAPQTWKIALLFVVLALAGEQVVSHRKFAKNVLRSGDLTRTIEYRAAMWAQQNLDGVRIMMPGSIGMWANTFTSIQQFGGESWSMAYNPIQQRGVDAVYAAAESRELDAQFSVAWLKAYGVGAVCVSGPHSPEFAKSFSHPDKFEGVLSALWRESDTTIYQAPQRTTTLAHVIPEGAILDRPPAGPGDIRGLAHLAAALDDPSLPLVDFRWDGRNRIHIRANAGPREAVFVQVSYHPGWHAAAGSRRLELFRDGLGLMWFRPGCNGACDIELRYDGGWELRLCRLVSILAVAGILVGLPLSYFGKRDS